jgi:hypothetical protein
MQNNHKNHVYDYIIVGGGLNGLTVAAALSKITENILLIEASESVGGHNRMILGPVGPQNNGLRFLPGTESAQKAVRFLSSLTGENIASAKSDSPSVTFSEGQVQSFLGFGDEAPAFYDEISYFTTPQKLEMNLEPYQWVQKLAESFKGEVMTRSYATKFQLEDGRIKSVSINGQKIVNGVNFIYCGPLKALKNLLPEGALNYRALQKLSKGKYWTAVCLDLLHKGQVTSEHSVHVLNGTTKDEVGPCVGQFHPAAEKDGELVQLSQWISFVDDEEAEDTENIGAALKKIKRQIKRAYPEALENLKHERILVVPSFSGDGDLKLSGQQTLSSVKNLWIGSATAHDQRNLVGALLQAELVTASLGCHPDGVAVEIKSQEERKEEAIYV